MARGIQYIPLRIPEQWSAQWFETFIREVLALVDVRNAVEGAGITIEGQPDEPATISSSEDLTQLITQHFILAATSSFLANERILEGETDVVEMEDEGPGGNFIVKIVRNGIDATKFRQSDANSIVGRPQNIPGNVTDITCDADNKLLIQRTNTLTFDTLVDADIPASIARDSEVTAAITAHEAAPDPHPQYLTAAEGNAAYQPLSAALGLIFSGTGSPEGVVTAGVGSLFLRTDGGANTTLYVKESGAGNTGWRAV